MATNAGIAQLATHAPAQPCEMPYQVVMASLANGVDGLSSIERCPAGAKPAQSHIGAVYTGGVGRIGTPVQVGGGGGSVHPAAAAVAAVQQQQYQQRQIAAAQQQQQQQQQRQMVAAQQHQQQQQQQQRQMVAAQQQQQQRHVATMTLPKSMPAQSMVDNVMAALQAIGVQAKDDDLRRAIQDLNTANRGGYRVNANILREMKSAVGDVKVYDFYFCNSLYELQANPGIATFTVPLRHIVDDPSATNAIGMVISVHKIMARNDMPTQLRLDIEGVKGNKPSPRYDAVALEWLGPRSNIIFPKEQAEELYTRHFQLPIEQLQKYAGRNIDAIFASRQRLPYGLSLVPVGSELHQFFQEDAELSLRRFGQTADTFRSIAGSILLFDDRPLDEAHMELTAIKAAMQEQSFAQGLKVSVSRADGKKWADPEGVCDHYRGHVATDVLSERHPVHLQLQIGFLLPQAKPATSTFAAPSP